MDYFAIIATFWREVSTASSSLSLQLSYFLLSQPLSY